MLAGCGAEDWSARGVAAGGAHSCALMGDGRVVCWGANAAGQLGDDTTLGRAAPVEVDDIAAAVEIAAGDAHSCARLLDGSVRCWGHNAFGQLGDGSAEASSVPVEVSGIEGAISIATGDRHSCAALHDGSVRCWGHNAFGQLGDGGTSDSMTPVAVAGLGGAVRVAAARGIDGESFSCALLNDGRVACWGAGAVGQLGDGTNTPSAVPVFVVGVAGATDLALGTVHALAVSGERVFTWGAIVGVPSVLSTWPVVRVAAGSLHSCALGKDARVRCWGDNLNAQLGGPIDADGVANVSRLPPVAAISAGALHSCAHTAQGRAFCWGENNNGRLGNGSVGDPSGPVEVTLGD